MGTFKYRIELAASADGPFRALDALVDTGSQYTWVPGPTLRELGLTPTETIEFTMANGKSEYREAVEALIRLDGRLRHTVCIFGREGDLILLGAYALEGFGLAADPVNKRLVRMPTIPAASTGMKRDQSVPSATARRHDEMVAARQAQYERTRGPQPDTWGAIASRFRADPRRELDPFLERLASFLRPDDVLVDIGGGAGRNSLPMASRCREVINVEPSAGMLAEFRASADEAGITNARAVQSGWLEADGIEGDVLLAAHVAYFVPRIQPFIEKLESAARRRIIIDELTVPPPNQTAGFFRLVYGEDEIFVPGPDELLPVLEEMGITPEVIDIGPAAARRPGAQSREDAINNELGLGWVRPDDIDRARRLFNDHFDELFIETPAGFARRGAEGVRELMITWEPANRRQAT